MYTSASEGTLRGTGGSGAIGNAGKTLVRTASTGTLLGKSFGAGGTGDEQAGMEATLFREMEKLIKTTIQAEKTLQAKDRVAREKLSKQLNGQLFKIDKDTGVVQRNLNNEPIQKISQGGLMKKKGSEEAALLGTLEEKLAALINEISLDEKGLRDLERHMQQIDKERDYMKYLNSLSQEFIDSMASEEKLGAVIKEYGKAEKGLQRAYHETRAKHTTAMQMLQDEFDYHPAYRRGFVRKTWGEGEAKRENLAFKRIPEEFTGRWFTPKRDPMKGP
jgi:hypothetical protein